MSNGDGKTQTLVIGAGPGGYAAAFLAADLGQEVTVVDPLDNPGGVCLHWGCIPSKALLNMVRIKDDAAKSKQWGIEFAEPKIDVDKIRSFKDKVVKQLTGGLAQLSKKRKVTYIQGYARFTDSTTVEIEKTDGGKQSLSFENAIIAAGARAATLPNLDLDSERLMYARQAVDMPEIPGSMLVIGGGYIGLELGSVYAKLGSEVSVVEMLEGIMPGADRDLVSEFEKANKKLFKEIATGTKVENIVEESDGLTVTLRAADGSGEPREEHYERVLVTIGNVPNTDGLGLENTGVETDERGFIKVNEQRRTSETNIYAIGDIAGAPLLAHKANLEGRVAAEAIAGKKTAYEPATIPAVEYTDPEIAWCGLTENEAKEKGIEVEVASFPWAAAGRAVAMGESVGKTKLVIDPKTERILGVGIAGRDAGDLIAEGVLAVEMASLASDLSLTVHPHPTFSETMMEAAEVFYGHSTHIYRPKT
jgi:dihydrolipoamide dehydrogenase